MFERDFNYIISNCPVLQTHKKLLKILSDDRVMCIGYEEDGSGYYIMECCDEWYYHNLAKEECIELSEMFKEIAENIKD